MSSPTSINLDILTQGGLIVFMEVYLYFQELYSVMLVSLLFVYMASGYRTTRTGNRACVLVLGDIGRSPRMQYHALSLAGEEFDVEMVGYGGSKPHEDLLSNKQITLHVMADPPSFKFLPSIVRYGVKVIYQCFQLCWVLFFKMKLPSHIFVQNPPAIPTLAVAWFACKVYGSKFVVDMHNYGYTILGITLGKTHPLVRFGEKFERFFGRQADGHFCVTEAMKTDLMDNWQIKRPITLYDRPAAKFRETPIEEQHELFTKLAADYPEFASESGMEGETAFTSMASGEARRLDRRPALLVSSTSWTEDEDFSILLSALEKYEAAKTEGVANSKLPALVCAITGKGPQKDYYKGLIEKKQFKHVRICTPWLAAEDYPKLLGSADLGVCLHYSSSGLDLPMKVVDMFGCGLPVCAIDFKCIGELVKHEENGLIFKDAEELSSQFQDLLSSFPSKQGKLKVFRENLKTFQDLRWEESWKRTVRPTLYT
ncbi:chitobiosyldiphosphodolichol beta-mannosyltransferase-like [Strongylocentrotus purpuratus]|uniref:Chitobiosyldiphosphodolichol beta-mannosyltransferase n=1 Tax=Strongylocentrotus purpuratus TaxID=7668 RepID=A0A7M7P929_STRPU|nr:chitobiosyldiphosphodolichol beta-mannosyltransferase-like [Strongylocentrotus purpuratus]